MKRTKIKIAIQILTAASFTGLALLSCSTKKTGTLYSNCKLPIADGRGGVAIGGFPRYSERLPSTGTVNATVIFVDFPDAVATKTPAQAYAFVSGATATFTEQSYSRLNYSMTTHLTWLRMSKNSTQYNIGGSGHLAYIQEAVALADGAVNFASTDQLVIIANPDASGIGNSGPAMSTSAGNGVTADGNEMLNVVTSAYDLNTWGSIWLNHETTHNLGLVDLYNYTGSNNLRDIGRFSYMGYNSFTSNAPGLTAWERWVLSWLDDSQIQCANPRADGEINATLTPIGTSGGLKAVVVPISSTKAVVVESRRASGIDASIAKTGALVYTVDTSKSSGYGPIQIFPKGDTVADPYFTLAPRAVGESVTVSGIKVEVTASTASSDTVRITGDTISIDR